VAPETALRLIPKELEIAAGLRLLSIIEAVYVRTDGRIGSQIGPIQLLLLRTKGRKTGSQRTAALLYVTDAGRPVVIGSKGGSDTPPAWVLNLRADPDAEIQIGTIRWPVRARFTRGDERARLWRKAVAAWPGYRSYQEKTQRQIQVIALEPRN
jgi:deazaflavin-dependent oxidoreductase (nitroreductase family)